MKSGLEGKYIELKTKKFLDHFVLAVRRITQGVDI